MSDASPDFPSPDGAPWPESVAALDAELARTFGALLEACEFEPDALARRPREDAWSGLEVLEHVALTDRFLLLLVDKIADRCRRRVARGLAWPAAPARFAPILPLTSREFAWAAPDHMVPTGRLSPAACAVRLAADRDRCRALLAEFPAGEGTLHRIRMSVVDERLDLYQYLALIALHARRHLAQLERALRTGA